MMLLPMKMIVPLVLLLAMATVNAAGAQGACPIVVDELVAVHAPAGDLSKSFADTLFGLTLASPEAQSFSGHLVVQTEDDQYAVTLPHIALKPTVNPNGIKY